MRIGLVPGVWSYGIGSVSTVLAVWEAAVRSGDTPVVFADPHFRPLLDRLGIAVVPLPGPAVAPYPEPDVPILRLDDLLSHSFYRDPALVAEVFDAQCDAFAAEGIDVLFHDYDLTTIVAAHRLSIPVLSPVTWPDHRAFGRGSSGHRAPATAAFEAFGPILRHLRGPRPASLSELLFDASHRLVFPLPAVMDPIIGLRSDGEYVGRLACSVIDMNDMATDGGGLDAWPRQGHRGVLAYTSGPPFDVPWYIERCTEAFDGTAVDVLVTAGRPDSECTHTSPSGNVVARPFVPLHRLLAKADVLICHGGRNTLASAVEAGVPAIVFAGDDPERGYFADTLAHQGIALSGGQDDWGAERLRAMVADLGVSTGAVPQGPSQGAERVVHILRELVTQYRG